MLEAVLQVFGHCPPDCSSYDLNSSFYLEAESKVNTQDLFIAWPIYSHKQERQVKSDIRKHSLLKK